MTLPALTDAAGARFDESARVAGSHRLHEDDCTLEYFAVVLARMSPETFLTSVLLELAANELVEDREIADDLAEDTFVTGWQLLTSELFLLLSAAVNGCCCCWRVALNASARWRFSSIFKRCCSLRLDAICTQQKISS